MCVYKLLCSIWHYFFQFSLFISKGKYYRSLLWKWMWFLRICFDRLGKYLNTYVSYTFDFLSLILISMRWMRLEKISIINKVSFATFYLSSSKTNIRCEWMKKRSVVMSFIAANDFTFSYWILMKSNGTKNQIHSVQRMRWKQYNKLI